MATPSAGSATRTHDVLVVGGGPAGAATAYWLGRAGHDVVVVERKTFPRESVASHLFAYADGWTQTVEYEADDARLPACVRACIRESGIDAFVTSPLLLGNRTLGWLTLTGRPLH